MGAASSVVALIPCLVSVVPTLRLWPRVRLRGRGALREALREEPREEPRAGPRGRGETPAVPWSRQAPMMRVGQ